MTATFTTGGTTRLTTTVRRANGNLEVIDFAAPILYGNVGKARFITSDKELIALLKAHSSFGSLFVLEREEGDKEEAVVTTTEPKEIDYRDLCADKENIVVEPSVTDLATAQNWCQRVHGTVFRARKSDTIKAEAAEKYNTIFPNLN